MADNTETNKVVAKLTLDISEMLSQFNQIRSEVADLKKQFSSPSNGGGNVYFDEATKGTMNLSQSIKELQLQFKESQIGAQQLYDKLGALRSQFSTMLDRSTPMGVQNDQQLRNALVAAQNAIDQAGKTQTKALEEYVNREMQLETDYASWLESEKAAQVAADKQHYVALQQNAKYEDQQRRQIERDYTAWWKEQLATRDNAVKQSFDQQLKLNDTLYQGGRISAQQYYDNLKLLDSQYDEYLNNEANKRIDILKKMYTAEEDMAKQSQSAIQKFFTGSGKQNGMHYNGFGMMNPLDMATMMASFTVMNQILNNVQQGLVQMDTAQAGLNQVFGQNIEGQQQLNQVTDQFIAIAEKYGASVQDVLVAGKQWGRQYHDIATAQALTQSSTMLSIVDNLSMVDSAKALEATMNALGMSVSNAADAQKSSMAIVDQWSNMAHNASVSANDLASGVEVSAGAARQAGMNLEQLNALIAAGVRNSGETGNVIGTMWKTVFAHISSDTPKIQQAFQTLGISMNNADGSMKPVYDLIIQMAQKSGSLDAAQKQALMTITGGVRQYSRFAQAISNVNTIQQDYQIATNSSGAATKYAQEQLHTMSAELNRLSAAIQQITHDTSSGGLGDFLKSLVVGLTNLINGLDRIPSGVDKMGLGFLGLIATMRLMRSTFSMVENAMNMYRNGMAIGTAVTQTFTSVINREGTSIKSYTDMLVQKINMARLDTTTTETQAVANEANTGAMEIETGATEGLTGALTAADIAAAAFTLGIGAIIAIATIYTMHVGAAAEKQQELSQSVETTNQQLAQQAQQMQQSVTTTVQNVDQLQTLANQYAAAKKAMDSSKQGSRAYNTAQEEMMSVQRQLISLVGEQAASQILASSNVVKALENERKAQLDLQVAQDEQTVSAMQNEENKTQSVITNTQKRIAAIQDEIDAQSALGAIVTGLRTGLALATGNTGMTPGSVRDQGQLQTLLNNLSNSQKHLQAVQSTLSTARNALKQQQIALSQLEKNPAAMLSGGASTGAGSGATSPSSKSGAPSTYPYQNISTEDTAILDGYKTSLEALTYAVKSYSTEMSMASTQLKSNNYDTTAAVDYSQAYRSEMDSLTQSTKEYGAENAKVEQLLSNIRSAVANVNNEYNSGNITAKQHVEALKALQSEYNTLTGDIKSNSDAIIQNQQDMVKSTTDMVNQVVSMLQSGYQAEKTIAEDRLQNVYQPQIDALNAQKQAITDQITALQNLWNAQSQQNSIDQLKQELANVKSQRNQQIVGTNGQLTYTYDMSKAQSIQQQLNDALLKQQHDAEIQKLTDQKNALDAQVKNLQNAYDQAKTQLDNYWSYRLQKDNLQTEAEAAIMKEGFSKALQDAQSFSNQMNNTLQMVQLPDLVQGKNVAEQMGLDTAYRSIGEFVDSSNQRFGQLAWPPHQVQNDFAKVMGLDSAQSAINSFVKNVNGALSGINFGIDTSGVLNSLNGVASAAKAAGASLASSAQATVQILNPNYLDYMQKMYNAYHKGMPLSDIEKGAPPKYQTVHFQTGGLVPRLDGVPGDHVHAMLSPGEIVVPSFRDLERMTNTGSGTTNIRLSVDKFEFPNVQTAADAGGFVESVTELTHNFYNYTRG